MRQPYPATSVEDATDTLTGVSFPDPYHWLEHNGEQVREWQKAQAELADSYTRSWPPFKRLSELVERFSVEHHSPSAATPQYAGGRWFSTRVVESTAHNQVWVADSLGAQGRQVFDPASEDRERPPFLVWMSPSPDGRTLAVGICTDGSETNTIRLVDVDTGRQLPNPPPHKLADGMMGAQWLPDSSGFFISALAGTAVEYQLDIFLHRRLPTVTTVKVDVPWISARDMRLVVVAGNYAVAIDKTINPIPVAITALDQPSLIWKPFVTSVTGLLAGQVVGDRYVAVTDIGAPRGRVVAVRLDSETPNEPDSWDELVPQSDAVLRAVFPVGRFLYLIEYVDTYARVRVVGLDGKSQGEVPLPGRGAFLSGAMYPLLDVIPRNHPDKLLFAFSSLTTSLGIYSHTPGQNRIETVQAPQARIDNAVVEDLWATSADGTRVPYHVVRRADVDATRPQPTLIYGYGGFNILLAPQFPGPMAAFVAAGGVFVHAHLRGGSELGADWWQGGRLTNKQNCFFDLYAIAEDLIAARRCTPQLLAVTGMSNGGLLAGVAATQRPELWAAVVPRVPILDLIGACRDPYGRMANLMDYANVDEPEEVRRLASFSPYHLVREGVRYPAVYLVAGDNDPRCPPWHARKFAARLQKATSGAAPILLRIWENAGHGAGTDKKLVAAQDTQWLAFTMKCLGLDLRS